MSAHKTAFKEIDVLQELYTDERPSDINLKKLAGLLGLQDVELANALQVNPSSFSRSPYAPGNAALSQWFGIFNLIIEIIHQANPDLSAEEVKLKMQRWLKLPRPEFDNQTPLEAMLKGKSRKVRNLLEQMLG